MSESESGLEIPPTPNLTEGLSASEKAEFKIKESERQVANLTEMLKQSETRQSEQRESIEEIKQHIDTFRKAINMLITWCGDMNNKFDRILGSVVRSLRYIHSSLMSKNIINHGESVAFNWKTPASELDGKVIPIDPDSFNFKPLPQMLEKREKK